MEENPRARPTSVSLFPEFVHEAVAGRTVANAAPLGQQCARAYRFRPYNEPLLSVMDPLEDDALLPATDVDWDFGSCTEAAEAVNDRLCRFGGGAALADGDHGDEGAGVRLGALGGDWSAHAQACAAEPKLLQASVVLASGTAPQYLDHSGTEVQLPRQQLPSVSFWSPQAPSPLISVPRAPAARQTPGREAASCVPPVDGPVDETPTVSPVRAAAPAVLGSSDLAALVRLASAPSPRSAPRDRSFRGRRAGVGMPCGNEVPGCHDGVTAVVVAVAAGGTATFAGAASPRGTGAATAPPSLSTLQQHQRHVRQLIAARESSCATERGRFSGPAQSPLSPTVSELTSLWSASPARRGQAAVVDQSSCGPTPASDSVSPAQQHQRLRGHVSSPVVSGTAPVAPHPLTTTAADLRPMFPVEIRLLPSASTTVLSHRLGVAPHDVKAVTSSGPSNSSGHPQVAGAYWESTGRGGSLASVEPPARQQSVLMDGNNGDISLASRSPSTALTRSPSCGGAAAVGTSLSDVATFLRQQRTRTLHAVAASWSRSGSVATAGSLSAGEPRASRSSSPAAICPAPAAQRAPTAAVCAALTGATAEGVDEGSVASSIASSAFASTSRVSAAQISSTGGSSSSSSSSRRYAMIFAPPDEAEMKRMFDESYAKHLNAFRAVLGGCS